jgi:hypothetical protein
LRWQTAEQALAELDLGSQRAIILLREAERRWPNQLQELLALASSRLALEGLLVVVLQRGASEHSALDPAHRAERHPELVRALLVTAGVTPSAPESIESVDGTSWWLVPSQRLG